MKIVSPYYYSKPSPDDYIVHVHVLTLPWRHTAAVDPTSPLRRERIRQLVIPHDTRYSTFTKSQNIITDQLLPSPQPHPTFRKNLSIYKCACAGMASS